ncbi:MAG: PAS domain S-box protein [Desulfuromonadaceae bacterium]|nr:PAS domain S-box protein [Desulfuromonadaceae bacterium]
MAPRFTADERSGRHDSRRLALAVALVFLLILMGVSYFHVKTRERSLQISQAHVFQTEQDLLIALLHEPLLRSDYVQARTALEDFFGQHEDYRQLMLKAPNGFELFSAVRASDDGERRRSARCTIHDENQILGVLILEKTDSLTGWGWLYSEGLFAALLGGVLMLAGLLWQLVRRMGLDPLHSEMARQQEQYQALFEQSREAVVILAWDGTLQSCNPAARQQLKLEAGQTLEQSAVLDGPALKRIHQLLQQVRDSGHASQMLTLRGSDLSLQLDAGLIELEDEKQIQLLIHDVSDSHRYQQNLQNLRDELKSHLVTYQSLFNGTADGLVVRDLNGLLLLANRPYLNMLGYTEQELLGTHCTLVSQDGLCRHYNEVLHGTRTFFECVHRAKDGQEIAVEVHSSLINYRGQKAILTSVRDIRERARTVGARAEAVGG